MTCKVVGPEFSRQPAVGRTLASHRSTNAANTQSAAPRGIVDAGTAFASTLREDLAEVRVPRCAPCRWMSTFTDSPGLSDVLVLPASGWFLYTTAPLEGPYGLLSRPASWARLAASASAACGRS
mgnify:CR=1 FL=1